MTFESATGLSESDLEALAMKLLGTQNRIADHNDSSADNATLEDDLYDGQFAAVCSYCGFWVRPDLLDADDICEDCIQQIEEEEQDEMNDEYCTDDELDDDGLDYGFHEVEDDFDDDFDDDDDIWEEEWDDADLDGIDDEDWEDD